MTPRILVLVAVILIAVWLLLFASLSDKAADHDTTRVIAAWGTPSPPLDESLLTTTTTARARTAPTKPQVHAASVGRPAIAAGTVNGYPCGGDLPPCYVLARESGGNPTAQNPRSTASGLWQFLDSTWANFRGYPKARLAPVEVQNEKARLVWANGRGCSHWFACGTR